MDGSSWKQSTAQAFQLLHRHMLKLRECESSSDTPDNAPDCCPIAVLRHHHIESEVPPQVRGLACKRYESP